MADRINFTQQINDSAQVGDILYFTPVDAVNIAAPDPIEVGPITEIGNNFVEVGGEIDGVIQAATTPAGLTVAEIEAGALPPLFMFRKDGQANVSTLVGYFAEVNLVQNATDRRELFGIGSEIFVSSK
tara:strand:+ start:8949 stop:9332 length:384 start_codon:yes stop_codon:yes gene_type:complete